MEEKYNIYQPENMESKSFYPDTIVLELITPMSEGNILDIGFGNGKKTFELSKKASNVFAVDIDPQLKEYAEANYNSANIQYTVADITKLDLPEDHYDIIHSQFCFFYILDKKNLLAKLHSVLKRGGQFIFADLTDFSSNPPIDNGCQRITSLDYKTMLSELGFTNIEYYGEENLKVNGQYTFEYATIIKCSK